MTALVILIEATPLRASDGAAQTVRLAGAGALYPYFYGGQHWRAGVVGLPTFITSIDFAGGDFGNGGVPQAAELQWAPSTKADLSAYSGYFWIDAPITVRIGPENANGTLPDVRLTGKVLAALVDGGTLKIALCDPAADLKKPLLTARFGGTGGLDGPSDWNGRIKERVWGRVWNKAGAPIDKANNIYAFADPGRPIQAFDAIRDKGAAAASLTVLGWQGSMAATFAALQTASVPRGGGVVCPSIACVKWWTQPAGELTADLRGEIGSGYVETTGAIVQQIVAAGPNTAFASGTIAAAITARPAPVGWVAKDDNTTIAAMIEELLGNSSLLWVLNALGQIEIREWVWGAPAISATSQSVKRTATFRPVATRKIGFRRNERKMGRGDLAAIVLAEDATYADGTSIEALKPAQAGADVTGGNTAAAISGQGPWATTNTPIDTVLNPSSNVIYNSSFKVGFNGWTAGAGWLSGENAATYSSGIANTTGVLTSQFFYIQASGQPFTLSLSDLGFNISNRTITLLAYDVSYIPQRVPAADVTFPAGIGVGNRASFTFTPTATYNYKLQIVATSSNASHYYQISKIKLERGAIATLWTDELTNGAAYIGLDARGFPTYQPIDTLKPAEAGSNVTETRTASAISGQGPLATAPGGVSLDNSTYFSVPTRLLPSPGGLSSLPAGAILYGGPAYVTVDSLRPAEVGSNVTETRTASAISGQGPLATSALTPGQVTNSAITISANGTLNNAGGGGVTFGGLGGGALGLKGSLVFGDALLQEQAGVTATLGNFKTSLGIASAIAGQGPLATSALTAGQVTNSAITLSANGTLNNAGGGGVTFSGLGGGAVGLQSEVYFGQATLKETSGGAVATLGAFKTANGTAAAIAGQGPWATTTTPIASVMVPGTNFVYNSTFRMGGQGWTLALAGGTAGGGVQYQQGYTGYNAYFYPANVAGASATLTSDAFTTQGYQPHTIAFEDYTFGLAYRTVALKFYSDNAGTAYIAGADITVSASSQFTRVNATGYAPSNAVKGRVVIAIANPADYTSGYCTIQKIKVEQATRPSPWTDDATNTAVYRSDGTNIDSLRPAELGSNVTETRTASAISGQGPLATSNLTPGQVTNSAITISANGTLNNAGGGGVTFGGLGGGALGLKGSLVFGDALLQEQAGVTATLGNFKTSLGIASAISGQGPGATASSLSQLNAAEGSKLSGIQANADVTANSQHTIVAGVTAIDFVADYQNVLLAGQLDRTIPLLRRIGTTDVSAATTWTKTQSAGITCAISAAGVLSFTAVASGVVTVTGTYQGVAMSVAISITRSQQAAPTTGGGGGGGGGSASTTIVSGATSNSYGTGASGALTLSASSSGQIDLSAGVDFFISGGSTGSAQTQDAYGKWQWRVVGGTFADVAAEVASSYPAFQPANTGGGLAVTIDADNQASPGRIDVNTTKTGLTNGTTYEFRWVWRKGTSGGGSLTGAGSFYAAQR